MALIALVEPEDVGIVLAFASPCRMDGEVSRLCRGTKLDLGDQGRLDPDNIGTSGIGQGRLLSLPSQLVQHLPQSDGLGLPESRADTSDVDEIGSAIGSKYQRAEAGRGRR